MPRPDALWPGSSFVRILRAGVASQVVIRKQVEVRYRNSGRQLQSRRLFSWVVRLSSEHSVESTERMPPRWAAQDRSS